MSIFDSTTEFAVKVEVTEESARHHAVLIGNNFTKNRIVVYFEELEEFIDNLNAAQLAFEQAYLLDTGHPPL